MPIDLSRPLAWRRAGPEQRALLQDLQANILKGHGRRHSLQLFLRFDQAEAARGWLHRTAREVTSAWRQLQDTGRYQRGGAPGGTVRLLALSHAGYQAIGAAPATMPRTFWRMPARASGGAAISRLCTMGAAQ